MLHNFDDFGQSHNGISVCSDNIIITAITLATEYQIIVDNAELTGTRTHRYWPQLIIASFFFFSNKFYTLSRRTACIKCTTATKYNRFRMNIQFDIIIT